MIEIANELSSCVFNTHLQATQDEQGDGGCHELDGTDRGQTGDPGHFVLLELVAKQHVKFNERANKRCYKS